MLFEIKQIQRAFLNHFRVDSIPALRVPDGDYLVPVYDEYFNVRITSNRIWIDPDNFDAEKAMRIDSPHEKREPVEEESEK